MRNKTPKVSMRTLMLITIIFGLLAIPAGASTIVTQTAGAANGTLTSSNTSTTGNLANPWLVSVSMISNLGPVDVLFNSQLAGVSAFGPGNNVGTTHTNGKDLTLTLVNNAAGFNMTGVVLTLLVNGSPSGPSDGASYCNGGGGCPNPTNNSGMSVAITLNPDIATFSSGLVIPTQSLVITGLPLTDTAANQLVGMRIDPKWQATTATPDPPTWSLVISGGLFMLVGMARRRGALTINAA